MKTIAHSGTISGHFPITTITKTRNAGTYSIVACDPDAGQTGIAVQSHWFAVGALVAWAEAGVGAVATQSFIEPAYGPDGLSLMKEGRSAPEALASLVSEDEMKEVRQVAMIDAHGAVDAFTGRHCLDEAGHVVGHDFSIQANMMVNKDVLPAMESAFTESSGDLAGRLMLTLEAAERAGGDIRGRQSAALIVVRSKGTGSYGSDRLFDLRVDDHPRPLEELRRLLDVARVYEHMNRGDDVFTRGDYMEASREYARAARLLPGLVEAEFWHAVALTANGMLDAACPVFSKVFSKEPQWRQMVTRLPKAGMLPDDPELIGKITGIGRM